MSTLLYINLGSLTYDSFKAALLCSFIVVATADAHIKHGQIFEPKAFGFKSLFLLIWSSRAHNFGRDHKSPTDLKLKLSSCEEQPIR